MMILCIGLNPAYQRTLTVPNFAIDTVVRAQPEIGESAAGKGINVARVLHTLGKEPLCTGFLGGDSGKDIQQCLTDEGIPFEFVVTANPTRTCITILDPVSGTHTEIVEEGKPVSPDEVSRMRALYASRLPQSELVIISGTVPQQTPDTIYADFITSAHQYGIPVLIDTQKQLLHHSIAAKPFLIKINRDELGAACQQPVDSEETLRRLMLRLHEQGVEWVVISHGKDETIVSGQREMWRVIPPRIQPVNPIGSGDSMLAGIAAAMRDGKSIPDAVGFGTACGAANALTLTPGCVRVDDITRLLADVRLERY